MGFVSREQVRVDEFESAYPGPTYIPGQNRSRADLWRFPVAFKADMRRSGWVVRKVPEAEVKQLLFDHLISAGQNRL